MEYGGAMMATLNEQPASLRRRLVIASIESPLQVRSLAQQARPIYEAHTSPREPHTSPLQPRAAAAIPARCPSRSSRAHLEFMLRAVCEPERLAHVYLGPIRHPSEGHCPRGHRAARPAHRAALHRTAARLV